MKPEEHKHPRMKEHLHKDANKYVLVEKQHDLGTSVVKSSNKINQKIGDISRTDFCLLANILGLKVL